MSRQVTKVIDVTRTYIPVDPNSVTETYHGTGGKEDYPENIMPVHPIEGKNFLPTSYGYKSYFGINSLLEGITLPDLRVQDAFVWQNQTYVNELIVLTPTGVYNISNGVLTHPIITEDPNFADGYPAADVEFLRVTAGVASVSELAILASTQGKTFEQLWTSFLLVNYPARDVTPPADWFTPTDLAYLLSAHNRTERDLIIAYYSLSAETRSKETVWLNIVGLVYPNTPNTVVRPVPWYSPAEEATLLASGITLQALVNRVERLPFNDILGNPVRHDLDTVWLEVLGYERPGGVAIDLPVPTSWFNTAALADFTTAGKTELQLLHQFYYLNKYFFDIWVDTIPAWVYANGMDETTNTLQTNFFYTDEVQLVPLVLPATWFTPTEEASLLNTGRSLRQILAEVERARGQYTLAQLYTAMGGI